MASATNNVAVKLFIVRLGSIAEQGNNPEDQDGCDEERTDVLMTPRGVSCRAEAAHVSVPNANDFPHAQPELTNLECKNTRGNRCQTSGDKSSGA